MAVGSFLFEWQKKPAEAVKQSVEYVYIVVINAQNYRQ